MDAMTTSGVDVGSVAAKAVVMAGGKVAGRGMAPTGADPALAAETAWAKALEAAGADRASVSRLVITGYGRRATRLAGDVVTEISAAARGAFWLGAPWGRARIVADLGGQDTKVIVLDAEGNVADFAMNDKCAAGTGRFLTLMAACLELDLAEMGRLSLRSRAPVPLNSTCAVFAESEVISLIAQGRKKEDIVAGLHAAIASRIATMVRQMGGREPAEGLFFAGGGAQNAGVRAALESALGQPVYVPPEPQFVVATGAALIAAGLGGPPRVT
ncbi:MAG: acyl-CoA dehydratase activase [Candidatus Brocadiia bacterium]